MLDRIERKKNYNREWYLKNRERILAKKKEYNKRNRERLKKYIQTYRKKNKERMKEYRRRYYIENRERIRDYRIKLREKITELVGNECIVCGGTHRLTCHEIHGKPHTYTRQYIINHHKDFIRLCLRCHNAIHNLAMGENINLEVIVELLKRMMK